MQKFLKLSFLVFLAFIVLAACSQPGSTEETDANNDENDSATTDDGDSTSTDEPEEAESKSQNLKSLFQKKGHHLSFGIMRIRKWNGLC